MNYVDITEFYHQMIKMDTYLSIFENYDIIILEIRDSAKSDFEK